MVTSHGKEELMDNTKRKFVIRLNAMYGLGINGVDGINIYTDDNPAKNFFMNNQFIQVRGFLCASDKLKEYVIPVSSIAYFTTTESKKS